MGSSINVSVFISTVRPLKTMRYWLLAQIMFGSCGVCFTCPLTHGFIPWKSDFSQFIFGFSCFSQNTLLFLSKICFWSRLRVYLAYNILSFVDLGFRGSLFNLIWSFQKKLRRLGRCAENQNGNLRWRLPLGVRPPPPPPLNGTNFQTFFYPTFFFAIESYIYETDFTLKKYHF